MIDLKALVRELETPSPVETGSSCLVVEDIEKLASLIEEESENNTSLKKFATGVRLLADDFGSLMEKQKLAEEVVSALIKQGSLDSSKIFLKLSELKDKDINDLKILDQALKLNKTGSFELGTVSDQEEVSIGFGDNAKEAV